MYIFLGVTSRGIHSILVFSGIVVVVSCFRPHHTFLSVGKKYSHPLIPYGEVSTPRSRPECSRCAAVLWGRTRWRHRIFRVSRLITCKLACLGLNLQSSHPPEGIVEALRDREGSGGCVVHRTKAEDLLVFIHPYHGTTARPSPRGADISHTLPDGNPLRAIPIVVRRPWCSCSLG